MREVCARAGARVESGQVILRFEARDLEARLRQMRQAAAAAEAAAKGGNAIARIPDQARHYLIEMHPDTLKAEREYVEALTDFDQAKGADREPAGARLRHTGAERARVRCHLAQLFAGSVDGKDTRAYQSDILRSIQEAEKLLREAEVRAPSGAIVDLLEVQAGEKIEPGQPVAVLITTGEYSVDIGLTEAERARVHPGMALKGRLDVGSGRIEARIESISMRKIPVIARENLQAAEEPFARVRFATAEPLRPGAIAAFELP